MKRGSKMSGQNKEGIPELHVAIKSGQFQDVRCLVCAGEDVNIKDRTDHRTPLMMCAMVDQEDWGVGIGRMLLANGAMVGHSDRRGQNALIYACIFGRCELVKVFLKAVDYDPNHRDRYGNTALFYAASSGHDDVVKVVLDSLLHFKLTLNRSNKWGMTPYLEACRLGHERIAQILEENGALVDVRDSILHWGAAEWRHDHQQRVVDEERKRKKKTYDKPWLSTNARQLKRTVSDVSNESSNGLPAISVSRTSTQTDLEDDVFFPPTIVVSPTKSETSIADPPPRFKPRSRELPSSPTKGRMVFKSWIEDFTKGNLITATFSPVASTPPCLLTQAATNVPSSCSLTDRHSRNRMYRQLSLDRDASSQFENNLKQIFQRYEIQSSDSFRQRARTPEAMKIPEIVQEIELPAGKILGKLNRQQSKMNVSGSSRLSSSSSSMELSTGRKSKVADLRMRTSERGKIDDSTSSVSSEDSAAARMMMNAFRRKKGSVVPQTNADK